MTWAVLFLGRDRRLRAESLGRAECTQDDDNPHANLREDEPGMCGSH